MHAYRDAIRGQEQQPVVQYAAILYPGGTQHFADGIAALQAYPGKDKLLQDELRTIFSSALNQQTKENCDREYD